MKVELEAHATFAHLLSSTIYDRNHEIAMEVELNVHAELARCFVVIYIELKLVGLLTQQ